MAKGVYTCIDNVSRNVKKIPVCIDGVSRNTKSGYACIDGVSREFFGSVVGTPGTNQFTVLSSNNDIFTWDVTETFNCDPGMTWGEWIESDYNTPGWVIDSVGFVRPSMYSDYAIFSSNGAWFSMVGSGDEITIGGTYYRENEIYM